MTCRDCALVGYHCGRCGCCAYDCCADCGHQHTLDGCVGDPTPSDLWAGVSPAACDCEPDASDSLLGALRRDHWALSNDEIDALHAALLEARQEWCNVPGCESHAFRITAAGHSDA